MRVLLAVLASVLVLAACAPPMLSEEQLADYARYTSLRATEAAANQQIASAKATEAAAVVILSQATPVAISPGEAITLTRPVTASPPISTTVAFSPTRAITATVVVTASIPVTTSLPLTATAGISPTNVATATSTATPTPPPTATATSTPPPTATETLTPTATATSTSPPTATDTSTPTATDTPPPTATATSTPPPTATATSTPPPTATATSTPPPTATATTTPPPTATATSTVPPTATATTTPPPTATTTPSTEGTPAGSPSTTPSPTALPTPAGSVLVRSSQVNLRGGPGLEFGVIGTAAQGKTLDVFGSNADRSWWQICCTNGKPGWVSKTVVTFQGDSAKVPVTPPLIPDDLKVDWAVRWECHAEGCAQEQCLGQSQASTLQVRSARWLEVKRDATWEGDCGEREEWITQVDRYTGQEQQSTGGDAPLFNIFAGANPGPENRTLDLLGNKLSLWCTDTRTKEVAQGQGWTVVFEGQACYDRRAGILATMQYLKRWLFTGEFEGKQYERQYFGDYEVYQQLLTETNAPLSGG